MREQLAEALEGYLEASSKLIKAVRSGNQELINKYADESEYYEELLNELLKTLGDD